MKTKKKWEYLKTEKIPLTEKFIPSRLTEVFVLLLSENNWLYQTSFKIIIIKHFFAYCGTKLSFLNTGWWMKLEYRCKRFSIKW